MGKLFRPLSSLYHRQRNRSAQGIEQLNRSIQPSENEGVTTMYYQTTARLKNGDYLMHLAQFSELDRSLHTAQEWAARPKTRKTGGYAIVCAPPGTLVFDSREEASK